MLGRNYYVVHGWDPVNFSYLVLFVGVLIGMYKNKNCKILNT